MAVAQLSTTSMTSSRNSMPSEEDTVGEVITPVSSMTFSTTEINRAGLVVSIRFSVVICLTTDIAVIMITTATTSWAMTYSKGAMDSASIQVSSKIRSPTFITVNPGRQVMQSHGIAIS